MCKFFSEQHHCCCSSLAIQGEYCSEKLDPWPDQIRMLHDKCLEEGHVQACGARCLLAMVWACLWEEHWADGYATSALQHWWADNDQYVCNRTNLHEAPASQYNVASMAFLILTYLGLYEDCLSSATGGGKGCLEGGRNLTPGSDRDLCLLLPGRDPSELKRRTATSRSVKGRDEFCKLLLYMYKLCSRTNLHHNLKSIFEVLITGLRTSWLTFIISRFEPAFDCLGSSWFHHFTDGLMAQKKSCLIWRSRRLLW